MDELGHGGLIERLEAVPYTGAISDILDELGLRDQVLPWQIRAIEPGSTVVGRALTALGVPAEGDNPDEFLVPFLEMLGALKAGDVIVSQPNDLTCAHLGELSSETAQYRGAKGAVIDGGVRDTEYIRKLGFPVFARYTTPIDIVGRWKLQAHEVPIRIGSTVVEPGDYVVGDPDGIVIIPASVAEEVVGRAEDLVSTENLVRREILNGMLPVEAYRHHGRF